jgi:thiol:disulfide interchange protein DsbC
MGAGSEMKRLNRISGWTSLMVILLPLLLAFAASPLLANDRVAARMAEVVPEVSPDSILPAPIPGMFEVRYGTDLFYVSDDARFLFQGNLIDLEGRVNLTEAVRQGVRASYFSGIGDASLTVFAPEGEVRHVLNIFTDPQCPHCRRLHQEMSQYLDAGIKVRYFILPVVGRDSPIVMRNIWCAEDRAAAMDLAKSGRPVADAECATPAEDHLALARELGINGTPATVTESGLLVSGYRPAFEMLMLLESQ